MTLRNFLTTWKALHQRKKIATTVATMDFDTLTMKLLQYQKAIEGAREKWFATFNCIPDPAFVVSNDFRFLAVNIAFEEVFKIQRSKVVGQLCYEVLHGEKDVYVGCIRSEIVDRRVAKKEVFVAELQKFFMASVSKVQTEVMAHPEFLHILTDITELKLKAMWSELCKKNVETDPCEQLICNTDACPRVGGA